MADSVDLKKVHKELYRPPRTPVLVDVPEFAYLMIDVRRMDWGVRNLVDAIEQSIIALLAGYGVVALARIDLGPATGTDADGLLRMLQPDALVIASGGCG